MTAHGRILENHMLVVRDGRIIDLLPEKFGAERYAAGLTIERPSHVVMPGMVNAHTHAAATLLRLWPNPSTALGPDVDISPPQRRYMGPEFVEDGVKIAVAEMLKSGITCFGDQYFYPDEVGRVAAQQGMRALIGMPVADFESPWAKTPSEYLRRALDVRDEYKGHPLISTAFAPLGVNSLSDDTLRRIATLAAELDAGVMMHLHASAAEIDVSMSRYLRRPIERLQGLGLLTPALNAVHMVELLASDIDLATQSGLAITLCPDTHLQSDVGLTGVSALLAAGLRLSLGTGNPCRNSLDLWPGVRLLASMKSAGSAMDAWQALAIATHGAAGALGLDSEIGTFEIGKWADLCCLDLDGPATQPLGDPLYQLVRGGGRDLVSDVWVAGRHLLSEGQFTQLDWPQVRAKAQTWATRLNQLE